MGRALIQSLYNARKGDSASMDFLVVDKSRTGRDLRRELIRQKFSEIAMSQTQWNHLEAHRQSAATSSLE
jgi:hypothetical protein